MYTNSPEEIFSRISQGIAGIDWLRHEVDAELLLKALILAPTDHICIVLCDVLGWRHERIAVSHLITLLEHESSKVRSAAADALAKIGDPSAGTALLKRLELPDPNIGVRRMLLAALGAVKCQEAIPLLIEYLQNPDPSQRGSASWSLGIMHVNEALPALEDALQREPSQYPKERMTEAIRAIRTANFLK
ncbi:HEAT repeat domain-containing protein [Nostoc sp.]|uniref:HEAT repeat domain-containing protein n=1 Tax=Nostoc sp. TaxID=1180 RepID=UPI002FF8D2D5